jgi:uncharacterized repeat protein (TIGR03943 family)
MSIRRHTAHVAALVIWAIFFATMWLTGETGRYLGERTTWVVPFGAVVTGSAAFLLLTQGRPADDRALPAREGAWLLALLAPILAVLAVPHAELGAAAAERRSSGDISRVLAAAPATAEPQLSLAHIMLAGSHPQPDVKEGVHTSLVGFVMIRDGTPPGEFQVTRFMVTCCIADATPIYVTVHPKGAVPPRDSWVLVAGPLAYREGIEESAAGEGRPGEFIVSDADVDQVEPPEQPYLGSWVGGGPPPVKHGTRPPDPTQP